MTVFNRERYLAEAIDSVVAQTWPDWELIVWDDGSSDRSVEIAKTYAAADPRIKVFANQHLGRGLALATATAKAKGEFMGFVDSDDYIHPTALAQTAVVLENFPQVGMVYTNYINVDAEGNELGVGKRCQIPFSKDRLLLDFMTFHFRLMRASVFWQVGGIESKYNAAQDYDLCLKLSEVTEIRHVPKPLYYYRIHGNSISKARQLEQVHFSGEAITTALKRRGLSEQLDLRVELSPKFYLQRK
ncbi:MAG: glycosyltransferase [Cyanobacteria bacterium P01_E01_bin.34]